MSAVFEDVEQVLDAVARAPTFEVRGRVTEVTGLALEATLPGARLGETCVVRLDAGPMTCEVVGLRDERVVLLPLGDARGVGQGSEVVRARHPLSIRCGDALLGRVLDALGRPIDQGPALATLAGLEDWPVERPPPDPLGRQRITEPLVTGVRAVDGFLTLGVGQRVGLFAGSGVGKSTLLGELARHAAADVVVVGLVGERGREVRDFLEDALGPEGRRRSVVVVATSDQPALLRRTCAFTATAVAEWFRDRGRRVLLLMDSVTRFARAQREVGLAAGEPPARQGYPPSVFAELPRLLERTGTAGAGSITALYTVLVQAGDLDEPIADEVRGILDGHVVLDRALGARNHWPAIDVLGSLSRVMGAVTSAEHRQIAARARELLATYERQRDLIALGAYALGSDPATDRAIAVHDALEGFLCQGRGEPEAFGRTIERLRGVDGGGG
jgi:type III secretion protein N (ATPase)